MLSTTLPSDKFPSTRAENSNSHGVNMPGVFRLGLIGGTILAQLVLMLSLVFAQNLENAKTVRRASLMKLLPRFESPSVPAMSPEEAQAPNFHPGAPQPEGLPGNGMAQHPMLYIGEGYNKMFLVNHGKIVWT
jgi:hypothetical protein